ncbi:FG-GAP repeat domain-containing protein [Pseudarcicella hirudinis]|uniref:FG-GAP repeat domain-containing protein n=1 Tax=Pseudarcicella hirudinis TaxID=1079859 RepID=UPI0035EC01CC
MDGDLDLFVGTRLIPEEYGRIPDSYLLLNDGKGNFSNVSKQILGEAQHLGMVTDASWQDVDGDKYPELVLVGDWMPVTILKNVGGKSFKPMDLGLKNINGWWNCIQPADIDQDGDIDFILGNLGLNHNMKASETEPAELYVNDFDKNGTTEQIINCYHQGKQCPMVLKADLQKQLPVIKQKFLKYSDYATAQIKDLFSDSQLEGSTILKTNNTQTSFLINEGNGKFSIKALPQEIQVSPVTAIQTLDYNHDGILDIALAGNFYDVLPEIGRYDANYGLILQGKGKGAFEVIKPKKSGFFTKGQVRKMKLAKNNNGGSILILAKNSDKAQVFSIK